MSDHSLQPEELPADILRALDIADGAEPEQPANPEIDISQALNPDNIANIFNQENISAAINRMAAHPEEISRMMGGAGGPEVSPAMLEQAKRLAAGEQGARVFAEMQRQGMTPQAVRAQAKAQKKSQRALQQLHNPVPEQRKQAILVTAKRQLKVVTVPVLLSKKDAGALLKCSALLEFPCSRLAVGPLQGQGIKIWYNPNIPGKNRRATKLAGFPVAGDLLIVSNYGSISEQDFLAVEKLLATPQELNVNLEALAAIEAVDD